MANPHEEFAKLDQKTKDINAALDELVRVLVGNTSTNSVENAEGNTDPFSPDEVWPDKDMDLTHHASHILERLNNQTVDQDMRDTIVQLFGSAAGSNPVSELLKQGLTALQSEMAKINKIKDDMVGDRLDAFNRLNNEHPAGEYGGGADNSADYGFIPAIEGVINAISGGNADLDNLLNEIRALQSSLNNAQAYAIFASYFAGTVGLLNKALFG